MKTIHLPFEIGSPYEIWEFDLELYPLEKLPIYDSYLYIREVQFLEHNPQKVELIFHWDILQIIILTFTDILMENITDKSMAFKDYNVSKVPYDNIELWVITFNNSDRSLVIYGNVDLLESIDVSLLW